MTAMLQAQVEGAPCVHIPSLSEPFSLALSPAVQALRDKALLSPRSVDSMIIELTIAEAQAWSLHTKQEDWLGWRARRTVAKLEAMPINLEPGERIVGKPLFRHPSAEQKLALQIARQTLQDMPPFPGGDAGHFHPDYVKLFRVGIHGIADEIRERSQAAGVNESQQAFYQACQIALDGLRDFILRVAQTCKQMAASRPKETSHWQALSAICQNIAHNPPETFHQAIQLLFLVQMALWFGEDHSLTAPGRLDQTLLPFYEADIAAGRITRRDAFELISCLYIQMNRVLGPGSAISVLVGGRDRQGSNVTNDLTYLCLAARQATQLVYPTVGLAWHENTPSELVDYAMRMLATGIGDPAFFNDPLITAGLRDHGVSAADSYDYMNSTCVEIKIVGASNMWVTQPYYNLGQELLTVMKQIAEGDLPDPLSFEQFSDYLRQRLAATVKKGAQTLHQVWQKRAETGGFPLASCFTADCLALGLDFDRGGARYNWVENAFVGLANLVDSLAAIRELVYERHELGLAGFYHILEADFVGHQTLHQRIVNRLPKYGNDDERVDRLATEWAQFLISTTEANQVGPHRYVPGFFCWIRHEQMGQETGATPDGRPAGWPLSDGAGAAQGREKQGPTASVLSTTKWSHLAILGGLVQNIKFTSDMLTNPDGLRAMRSIIETYLQRGGFEIQVNVVNKNVLLEAQAHPESHADLVVRVAGYSDYFVHLNRNMQDEVIARTEHGL